MMLFVLRKNQGFMLKLMETVSTRCSEIGPRYNEQARVSERLMLSEYGSRCNKQAQIVNQELCFGFCALVG